MLPSESLRRDSGSLFWLSAPSSRLCVAPSAWLSWSSCVSAGIGPGSACEPVAWELALSFSILLCGMCLALLGVLTGRHLAGTKASQWFDGSSLRAMVGAGAGCGGALGTGATPSTLALKLGGGIGGARH